MGSLTALVNYRVFDNELWKWVLALAVWMAALPMLKGLKTLGVGSLRRLATGPRAGVMNRVADLLDQTHRFLFFILALNIALFILALEPRWRTLGFSILCLALLVQAGVWINALIDFYIEEVRRSKLESDPATVTTMAVLGYLGKLACLLILFIMSWKFVFHEEPTALITGLGIGGIAVGLAAQHILGDLFASMTIVLDKPFVIGDFIIIGDFMGSVEHVGLKSTRLRSLSGEQLVFSNHDLLTSRIRNYKRMFERRVLFKINVVYQTPLAKLRALPGMIRAIVQAQPQTRFDRSHFSSYGDFALTIETVYFMLVPDYNAYMDTQQAINFAIYEQFEKEGIAFAAPSQAPLLQPAPAPEGGTKASSA